MKFKLQSTLKRASHKIKIEKPTLWPITELWIGLTLMLHFKEAPPLKLFRPTPKEEEKLLLKKEPLHSLRHKKLLLIHRKKHLETGLTNSEKAKMLPTRLLLNKKTISEYLIEPTTSLLTEQIKTKHFKLKH